MTIGLKELIAQQQQAQTGTSVVQGEGVSIAPSTAGEETKITTSAGDAGITVSEESGTGTPLVTIGDGESVRSVTNVINETDPNNSDLLATVAAINARINAAVAGALAYEPLHSKADFDTFLATETIAPSIVFVNDTTPFDYTDTNGLETTGMTWWLGVISKTSGQALDSDTLFTSESQNSLTGVQISTALYALADHNQLTDSRAAIVDSIEATVTSGLADKVDKVTGKGLTKNELTDSYKAILDNSPADISGELSGKLDKTSSGENLVIDNPGNDAGYIQLINSAAPTDQRVFQQIARSDGTFDFEALDDSGALQSRWEFNHDGRTNFPNQIKQNGNDVVDVTYTKLVNTPADTNAALQTLTDGKVDKDGLKVLSDVNFTQADKDHLDGLGGGDFNGGAIENPLVVKSDSRTAIVLKAVDNLSAESGFAVQNTGNNYTLSMHRENTNTSNDWLFKLGSNANINALPECVRFSDGAITATFKGGVHADGDIFAFNGGNMAARDISSVGKFVGSDYRLDGSNSNDYNLLYTATQGNSNSPEGNRAADGKSLSGDAVRLRVPNQTNKGLIVENENGLNLFEINGSTGIAYTVNQLNTGGSIFFPRNSRVGRTASSHSAANSGTVQYGSIVGSSFTGMEVNTIHDGTYNDEEISFWTNTGGGSAGSRMTIGKDGRSIINDSLLIGSNSYPSRELEVIGDARISDNLEVDSNIELGNKLIMRDNSNREFKLESRTNGLAWRSITNPSSSGTLFSVENSGNNGRLRVENGDKITSSNSHMWLKTDANGVGGRRVCLIRDVHYFRAFPSLSKSTIVDQWLGNSVYFTATGSGSINLPTIVTANPSADQMQVGDHFFLFNFNSGADVTLVPASGQNKWMRDVVESIVTGNIVLGFNEAFKISAVNNSYYFGGFGYMVRRISMNDSSAGST